MKWIAGLALTLCAAVTLAQTDTRPVTIVRSPAADLVRKWYAEGTAAGNAGDRYDNRDREHSGLRVANYPQLGKITYTEDQLKARTDWAAQRVLVPGVVFGNSSTSSGVTDAGSNVRMYYVNPRGLAFLHAQYVSSNLYIYPEHRDHDPGHNGPDGYGDQFPTNTPYLICSQGSSGSDRPFMAMMPHVLAAFRPEVKKKLIEDGLLMPTVQMIFRISNKHLAMSGEYLTGKAHPTVFEGSWVDEEKMVRIAQSITLPTLPPAARLTVREEDLPIAGRDYFDIHTTERLADTPAVVARIWRGTQPKRRIVLSAESSTDVNRRPLTYRWSILRGDESRIQIKPLNDSRSQVELTVGYHERRPVLPGSAMESNRVDIGLFVNNGVYWSAPAFITFFSIDSESRTYDAQGRLLEMGYGTGNTQTTVNHAAFFELLKLDTPAAQLLKAQMTPMQAAILAKVGEEHAVLQQAFKSAEAARKAAPADQAKPAQTALDNARKAVDQLLTGARDGLPRPPKAFIDGLFARLIQNPAMYPEHADVIATTAAERKFNLATARKRLVDVRILKSAEGFELSPIASDPTLYERAMIERFNAEALAGTLYAGVMSASWRPFYVDPNIATPKNWRDIYHHDPAGKCSGWTRYAEGQKPQSFTSDGLLIETDGQGNQRLRAVKYEQPPRTSKGGLNYNPLRMVVE